jgi:tetratricopeptide (TPR) repeat protein
VDRQVAIEVAIADGGIAHNGDRDQANDRAAAAPDTDAPDDPPGHPQQSASDQPATAGHTEPQAANEKDRALADYEAAIRVDPNNPALFRDRGILWRRNGDLDRALVDFDRAIRMGFSDAAAYNERGLVWYEKKSLDRAIADFNQALKINPNLVDALINRGNALRRKGDLDHAIADFDEAIRIDPNADAARQALARSGLAPATNDDVKELGLPSNGTAHVAAPPLP